MGVITREVVRDHLMAYFNQTISLADLVDWAENTFIDAEIMPESDIPLLNGILGYLAAADSPQFPLTWEVSQDFMRRLGWALHVQIEMA